MSGGKEIDVLSIFVGFFILVLILSELHGFSASTAIFAIPVLILAGLLTFVSFLLGVVLGSIVGAASTGVIGLLLLGIVAFWLFKGLAGITSQNYLVFAILVVILLMMV